LKESKMKRLTIRIAIACCTFIVGVVAASVWFGKPAPIPTATPDPTVYSVALCDLVRDAKRFDGKIVRIQAFSEQGTEDGTLTDSACKAYLHPFCAATDGSCMEIMDRLTEVRISSNSFRLRIDVVGRYADDMAPPGTPQSDSHPHAFEMLELKEARPADMPNK
jgi:hypothetical protein